MATHFRDQVYSRGMLLGHGNIPTTFGKYFFVDADNGSDSNSGERIDQAFATVSAGYNAMRTNKHDVLIISSVGSHTLSDQLSVTKNRCHFVGLDPGAPRHYGQRAKLNLGVTTGSAIAAIKNTGVGNSFRNLKVTNSDTLATSLYGVAEGGEFTVWEDCEFLKTTDLDQTGAAEVLHNGDSCVFRGCAIGNMIYRPSVARQNMLFARETITGKVARDVLIEDCIFMGFPSSTSFVNVTVTGNDIERLAQFKDCVFAAKNGSATQALAFGVASALTDAYIVLKDCVTSGITDTAGTSKEVYTNSPTAAGDATEVVAVSTT